MSPDKEKKERRKSIFQSLLEKAIGQQPTIEKEIEKQPETEVVDEDDHRMDHLNENSLINQDDPVSVLHRASLVGDLQKLKKILKRLIKFIVPILILIQISTIPLKI